jgi:hypothetical protein
LHLLLPKLMKLLLHLSLLLLLLRLLVDVMHFVCDGGIRVDGCIPAPRIDREQPHELEEAH